MKQIFKKNLTFFVPTIIIWLVVLACVLTTSKFDQMQFINSHNDLWADYFFVGATQLGEGWFWAAIILLFLFVSYNRALIFTASLVLSTLLSTSLKFFFDTLRPIAFFRNIKANWHLVEGIDINVHLSFPSGHTTTAFAIFTMLTLFSKNKNWGFVFVMLAWLTGYSRCYLFQHFPEDVLGGVIIGVFSSIIVYIWLMNLHTKNPKAWHKKRLLGSGE
ncbi:PAP2 superfamily protein [Arcicella aurantiaca]|uniref:PAP2 superfamily protein n=1 Tax=Arcicella aurantiaca TaxID=591202 RepID=A0A316E9G4_9BACT|nr:phosphatase PAP2 family protein [Arcicella aurantiaca]PWK26192.1 PAP2 superfamily protein [Arcicella aurantiaca]